MRGEDRTRCLGRVGREVEGRKGKKERKKNEGCFARSDGIHSCIMPKAVFVR